MQSKRVLAFFMVLTLIFGAVPAFTLTGVAQDATPEVSDTVERLPETGPVFVYSGLRVSVVAAVNAPAINALALRRAEDKAWVVVIADITNVGSDSITFDPGAFSVYDGNEKLGGYAKRTTSGLADVLGGEPLDPDAGVVINAESTERVFWVYRIDDNQTPETFGMSPGRVPLEDLVEANADLQALPAVVSPLPFREVLVDRVLDGATLSVYDEETDENRTVELIGVDAPFEDDCYGEASVEGLEDLAGSSIWIEPSLAGTDERIANDRTLAWIQYEGSWALLNQVLITTGNAGVGDMRDDNRYESWMRGSEGAARRGSVGLWGVCDGPHGSLRPTPTPAPEVVDAVVLNDQFTLIDYFFVDTGDDLVAYGEIINTSDTPALAPVIVITFLDENGTSFGSERVLPEAYWVPAGSRMPFQTCCVLGGALKLGDWSSLEFSTDEPYYSFEEVDMSTIEIRDVNLTGPVGGSVRGTLHNVGNEAVSGPFVITPVYYDANGQFVGLCFGDYLDVQIPAGRSVRFEVYVTAGCGFTDQVEEFTDRGPAETYALIASR